MKRLLIPSAASALALLAAITPTAPGLAAPPPGDGDLDLDPPTIAITPDQPLVDGWSTGAVTLAVKLTDVGSSGVGGGRWTLTGATSRSGSIVATSASIQVENPGRTTLTVEAWDRDGNEAERQLEVGVDTAAPTITLGPNLAALDGGSVDPGTTTVDYSCADAGSGVASCTGDLPVGAALDTGTTRSFTIVATDRVGRTTERTLSWQVKDQPWHVPTQPTFSPAGDIHVGDTLTADPLEITPTPDEVHYQWYRDGAPIPGATGASYTTTAEDAGAEVRYIAIPSKPGYAPRAGFASDWRRVLPPLVQVDGPGFRLPAAAKVGQEVKPLWGGSTVQPGATLRHQWTRDGKPIAGATGTTYRLRPADAGHRVGLVVTASAPDHSDWQGEALTGRVAKAATRTRASARVLPGRAVRLKVRVTAAGVPAPGGTVVVRERGRVLGKVRLVRGAATITLPRRTKGAHTYGVAYRGATGLKASQARAKVRVR